MNSLSPSRLHRQLQTMTRGHLTPTSILSMRGKLPIESRCAVFEHPHRRHSHHIHHHHAEDLRVAAGTLPARLMPPQLGMSLTSQRLPAGPMIRSLRRSRRLFFLRGHKKTAPVWRRTCDPQGGDGGGPLSIGRFVEPKAVRRAPADSAQASVLFGVNCILGSRHSRSCQPWRAHFAACRDRKHGGTKLTMNNRIEVTASREIWCTQKNINTTSSLLTAIIPGCITSNKVSSSGSYPINVRKTQETGRSYA